MPEAGVPKSVFIEDELQKSYLALCHEHDYLGRASRRARRAQPVHRACSRMNELSLEHNKPAQKNARAWLATCSVSITRTATVAVYDTLVRMAQDFPCA